MSKTKEDFRGELEKIVLTGKNGSLVIGNDSVYAISLYNGKEAHRTWVDDKEEVNDILQCLHRLIKKHDQKQKRKRGGKRG